MYKKIALMLLSLTMAVGLLAGCTSSAATAAVMPEKTPITVPETMLPAGIEGKYDDDNKSGVYYEMDGTLAEVEAFYGSAFEALGVQSIESLTAEQLEEKNIVPAQEEDSLGTIVWASHGIYDLPKEQIAAVKEGATPVTTSHIVVICAEENGKVGVEVGVGYRGANMADSLGFIKKAA